MGLEDSLEEGMAAHVSTLVLRINGYRILMGYSLRALHRVKHNWNDLACTCKAARVQSPADFLAALTQLFLVWFSTMCSLAFPLVLWVTLSLVNVFLFTTSYKRHTGFCHLQPRTLAWNTKHLSHSTQKSESEVAQLCLTLCNPMNCNPPHSSVHGILQARIPEWVAISFSRGSSPPRDRTQVSCIAGRFFTIWASRESTQKRSSLNHLNKKLQSIKSLVTNKLR